MMNTNNNIEKEAVEMNSTEEKAIVEQSTEDKAIDILNNQEVVTMPDEVTETEPIKVEIRNLSDMIDTDYRGIPGASTEIQAIAEQGFFNPTYEMAHIVNRLDNRLYARILVDAKGTRTIGFRQLYDDGSYSVEFQIKQDDLLILIGSVSTQDSFLVKEAKTCQRRFTREYLSKCDGRKPLNPSEVINVLAESLCQLPIVSEHNEMSKQELYARVIEHLRGTLGDCLHRNRRKGYIILSDNEIYHVCKEIGLSKKQLLARLKREGLLYLTDSCTGYQAKVPYCLDRDGKVLYEWSYCLYDLEYFARKKNPEKYGPAEELDAPLKHIMEL